MIGDGRASRRHDTNESRIDNQDQDTLQPRLQRNQIIKADGIP
jgi:hypothetical protein